MLILGQQGIVSVLQNYWPTSLTMIGGSFVAGATPLGGGAVAFGVLTKLMNVNSVDASIFSFFIQAVGMSFATLFFISRRTFIDWQVIKYALLGSFLAIPIGLQLLTLENITIRFIFTQFIVFCAFTLVWKQQNQGQQKDLSLLMALFFGFVGGLLSAKIGSGCDAILYFYLVFMCNRHAKTSIPTSVCFMAINSVYASLWLLATTTPSDFVVGSWWAAAPVVSVGAPLGAYVLSKLKTSQTVTMVLAIISVEVISSLLFSSFSVTDKVVIIVTISLLLLYTLWQQRTPLRQQKPT